MRTRMALAAALIIVAASAARADVFIPPPGPERIALADVVAVVRVVGLEPQDVEVKPGPAVYRVAAVTVAEPLFGSAKDKMLRVGFPPPPAKVPRRYVPRAELKPGQTGLLFARKVPGQTFYAVSMHYDFVVDSGAGSELAKARQQARLLADPAKGLKSTDANERLQTAALLVARYRVPRPGATRAEPVSAEETRQILAALLEPDWQAMAANGERSANPWQAFNQLGLTAEDDWAPPREIRNMNDLRDAAREWSRRHGEKYRLRRFVAETPPAQ